MNREALAQIGEWADLWAPAIWRATWQGGLFVAVVWIACRVFRRIPANVRYWMWWVACLQLAIRVAFVAPIALPILPADPVAVESPTSIAATLTSFFPEPREPAFSMEFIEPVAVPEERAPAQTAMAAVEPSVSLTPNLALFGVWATAILGCAIYSLRRFWRARRLLADASPIENPEIREWLEDHCTEWKIRVPRLRESEAALCPMLSGWWRPTIVLPLGFADTESEATIRMAVAHELAHLRRHDLWFGIVPALTQTLFVFHPLAWLAAHETAAAREEACDMDALAMSGGSPAAYARLLLNTAQASSSVAALGAAFGYRLLHRRIQMLNRSLLSDAHRYRRASVAVLALGLICALPWTVTAQTATKTKDAKSTKVAPNKKTAATSTKSSAKPAIKASPVQKAAPAASPVKTTAALTATNIQTTRIENVPATAASKAAAAKSVAPAPAKVAIGGAPTHAVSAAAIDTSRTGGFGGGGFAAPTQAAKASDDDGVAVAAQGGFGGGGFGGNGVAKTSDSQGFGGGGLGGGSTTGSFGQAVFPNSVPLMQVTCLKDKGTTASRLSVHYRKVDLRNAISEFMEAAGLNYVIQSNVMDETVTCNLSDVSFDEGIKAILGSVQQRLSYRREGSVFYFTVSAGATARGD